MSLSSYSEKLSSKFKLSVEKYELSNGLQVVLNPDSQLKTASYILGYATGSRHERPGITGISHMFEHLMFKGTKKYPKFDKTLAKNGVVSVNAFTSWDMTAYLGSFPPEQLELILDVESDRMTQLTFVQKEIDTERGAVQEERLMRVDNSPAGLLFENLMDLVFKKHPYRWPIIGYSKDIAAYTLEDFKTWYDTYYSPNNATLVISGNFSVKKAKELIEKYFGHLKSKKLVPEVKVVEPEQKQARFQELYKDIQAPLVMMTYLTPKIGTKESYALDIISSILGQGESSVLYKKMVRQNKKLTSISVGQWGLNDYSLFMVDYSLSDISQEEEIRNLVLKEMQKGIKESLNKKSLEKVKNIEANQLLHSLKRSMGRARLILSYEIYFKDYRKLYEKLDTMEEISLEYIQKVGEKYLDSSRLSYVIIKPEKSK